ncbi:MAG: NifB/NifX family molybdenum-iron cluster-binding protein [Lachnospiraceae bacterium]|nr:NifB/NifX family molybdenum-iron cluster-binding protein [Lachnospiraceae bacterium]
MRIAVTYENGEIFQHFGHTENFKIYDVADGVVVDSKVISSNGQGHGALAILLAESDVEVLICGGIGGGAQMALAQAGIKLFGGVSGSADAAVEALLKQELIFNPNVKCNHHGEGHEHHGNCGSGGCGSHSCGH